MSTVFSAVRRSLASDCTVYMMRLFICFTLVVCSGIALGHDEGHELPNARSFTQLAPGQLTIRQYESIEENNQGRSSFAGGRRANNVTIRNADIMLTTRQYAFLFKEKSARIGFKAEIDERRRWTDALIPYTIDEGHFSEHQTKELLKAMEILEKFTCLRFKPKEDGDENWVKYTDNNSGCNSQLGMMGWGEQAVNLGSGCKWRGLYLHEIGHALGLIHEHQRPDRDDHVKVIWRRVKSDYLDAFTTYKNEAVNDFGIEYDYSSIMHYEPEAFNDDQELTTIPRDEWQVELMFRVYYKTLSFTDTRVLNEMYKCGNKCPGKPCPPNSYRDKDCKCVTPQDIHDALCVNERPDEECYEQVKRGDCNAANGAAEMHIECRKACGSCPTYGMKDFVEPRLSQPYDACADRYHDGERCAAWAAAGDCERHPHWMKRNCRKSCNACDDVAQSGCRNYYKGAVDDQVCDEKAANGECETDTQVKAGCQGSCDSCGFQIPGDCEDVANCEEPASQGQCDDNNPSRAAQLQVFCRKSCNSCFMNRGECENELSDQECEVAASQGLCRIEAKKYKKECRKACNSCDFGIKDTSCKDIYPAWACNGYAESGTCGESKGYAYRFCASSCNKCDWARNPPCEDFHESCAPWAERGECDSNHQWMSTHCAKSCGTCDRYGLDKCANVDGDAFCEVNKKHGSCEKFGDQMERDCRRSCGHCEAPPIDKLLWECKDLSENCEFWQGIGECESNPVYLEAYCHKTCGHCKERK